MIKGTCFNCKQTIKRKNIMEHLNECINIKNNECFIIVDSKHYLNNYWLVLLCTSNVDLYCVDLFLRNVWLECCGHMSSFNENKYYDLYRLFNDKKTKIHYEYDMGSTTHITLNIVGKDKIESIKNDDVTIKLVARNNKPKLKCSKCKKKLASTVLYEKIYCNKCLTNLENYMEDQLENMILPLVNSPRTGLCGFEGIKLKNEIYYEQYTINSCYNSDSKIYLEMPNLCYNDSTAIRGKCKMCDKKYLVQYMSTHLRKLCAKDKMIVKLIYENVLPKYEHDNVWVFLECPNINLNQLINYINEKNIYSAKIKINQIKKNIDLNINLIDCDNTILLYLDEDNDFIDQYIKVQIYNKNKCNNCDEIKILAQNNNLIKKTKSYIKHDF